MDPVARFVLAARDFVAWCEGHASSMDALSALRLLSELYAAALHLPEPATEELLDEDLGGVTREEWKVVYARAGKLLPLGLYGMVDDPLVVPAEEPVLGDLADDVADTYRDVAGALRAFDAGHTAEALWEWRFGLRSHWGGHVTGALVALHAHAARQALESPARADAPAGEGPPAGGLAGR